MRERLKDDEVGEASKGQRLWNFVGHDKDFLEREKPLASYIRA